MVSRPMTSSFPDVDARLQGLTGSDSHLYNIMQEIVLSKYAPFEQAPAAWAIDCYGAITSSQFNLILPRMILRYPHLSSLKVQDVFKKDRLYTKHAYEAQQDHE